MYISNVDGEYAVMDESRQIIAKFRNFAEAKAFADGAIMNGSNRVRKVVR